MNIESPSSRNAGFTLLEALIATVVMGIIIAALATVTAQWLPNWDRGVVSLQHEKVLAVGLDRLTDDLAAAEFVSAAGGKDTADKKPIFEGSNTAVVFVRSTLAPGALPGLELVRYAELSDELGTAFVRSTAPLPTGTEASNDVSQLIFSNPVAVIRQPYRVSLSYAGTDRVWRNAWEDQVQLPRAVRVQVRDNATSTLLQETTSTLIHAELAARCVWANSTSDGCPVLGKQPSANANASGAKGGAANATGGAPVGQ